MSWSHCANLTLVRSSARFSRTYHITSACTSSAWTDGHKTVHATSNCLQSRVSSRSTTKFLPSTFKRFDRRLSDVVGKEETVSLRKDVMAPSEAPIPDDQHKQQKPGKPKNRVLRIAQAAKSPSLLFSIPGSTMVYQLDHSKLLGTAKAMSDYCLKEEHLRDMIPVVRRSPYIGEPPCKMYRQAEVLAKALEVHGSTEALEAARARGQSIEFVSEAESSDQRLTASISFLAPPKIDGGRSEKDSKSRESVVKKVGAGTERVVLTAIAVNAGAFVIKLAAWWYTGSHSLMAEALHSLADTINQVLVAYGVHQSLRKPDKMHPYGYSNVRYVTSLISGVGIFYVGSAMSLYHGLQGLWSPGPLQSVPLGILVLSLAFCGDGITFLMARKLVMKRAAAAGMTVNQYVRSGEDPSLTVVYLEDRAALFGVAVATTSLSLSLYASTPLPDALGSACIGILLFQVAYRIIAMNVDQLVGKSIPPKEIDQIARTLEADPMIRSIQDIKATELGSGEIRFKAEVDFDGRNITKAYLATVDSQSVLKEAQSLQAVEELEQFLMKHGDNITDRQGAEIDRIEQELKKKYPDIRHVDLEAL